MSKFWLGVGPLLVLGGFILWEFAREASRVRRQAAIRDRQRQTEGPQAPAGDKE